MGGFPPSEASNIPDTLFANWEMDHVGANIGVVTYVLGVVHHIHFTLHEILPGSQLGQAQSMIKQIASIMLIKIRFKILSNDSPFFHSLSTLVSFLIIKMYNPTNSHRQLFLQILSQTTQHKSIRKMEKSPEQVVDKLATRLLSRSEEMRYNNGIAAQFCISELKKNKEKIDSDSSQLHNLQKVQVKELVENSDSYFRKCLSPKQSTSYTYLKSSKYLYMFNRAFLPVGHQFTITFILTEGQIQYVISYIQLCISLKKLIRCIMPKSLWVKVKDVLQIVWGKYVFQLFTPEMLLLFNEQKAGTFDFEDSILIFNRNFWCWDSFTAHIMIKGANYMIKGPGITDEERIYSAWRKNIIDEPEYCRLIDKTLKTNVVWTNQNASEYAIKGQCTHYTITTIENFRSFLGCELFNQMDQDTIKQVYLCGEIVEYIQGQILYKANTILDKFFVVLEGFIEIIHDSLNSSDKKQCLLLNASDFFCLQTLTEEISFSKMTLQASSAKAVIFSIPLWKMKYLLGHDLEMLKDIDQYDSQILADYKQKSLSKWMRKVIRYVQQKSRNLSEKSTKILGAEKIKITNRLWRQICNKDLSILHQTHEELGWEI